jgi:hypothetical protein
VSHEAGLMRQDAEGSGAPRWALAAFGAYLVWNIGWLVSGRIPPSVLLVFLGLPCPTTGCTRSLLALLHGDLRASLLWNPFTIPILFLLMLSLHSLVLAAVRKRELVLPGWMGTAWWAVLLMAWISKFMLGRAYW